MIPELSLPVSSTTTEFASSAARQLTSNASQMLYLPMPTKATVTPHDSPNYSISDFGFVSGSISLPSAQYVISDNVPHISTFPVHVGSEQKHKNQSLRGQNIEYEIEKILSLGAITQGQEHHHHHKQQQQGSICAIGNLASEMFTPMSLASEAGAVYSNTSQFNNPRVSQNQSHTGSPLVTRGSQQHSPESTHIQYQQCVSDNPLNAAWSQSSPLGVAQASSVSPPMWNLQHFDQKSPLPAVPVNIPAQRMYSGSSTGVNVTTYPCLSQHVQRFSTIPSSSQPYFSVRYTQKDIPAISASSSFGTGLSIDSAFQGIISASGSTHLSTAGTFQTNSDSDNTSDTGFGSTGGNDGSLSWKNKPRNSITRRQKIAFYQWLLANARFPFPTENDRLGRLAIDRISEKKFKYWFANIRCRQFTKHRDGNGEVYFVPNAKFYESCLRLKIAIPYAIPDEIRATIKMSRSHGL